MKSNVSLHTFDNGELLAEELGRMIASDLSEAIEQNGKAVLMVSGGNTPKKLFATLSEMMIPWDKVRIGLCDERWISPEQPQSNEKLVREHLMRHHASAARFIGMYCEGLDAAEAEKVCSQTIRNELWPIDVCVLGMGDDAHTASLFPNNPKLSQAFDPERPELCIAITPDTAPFERMSLTRKALLESSNLYLHFEGEKKLKVFTEALENADMYAAPIVSVFTDETKCVEVYYA